MKNELFDYAKKQLKDKVMSSNKKSDRAKHADTIVRNHIIWAMGASFIPVPIADIFAVSALQLDMIRQICRVYDRDFSETQGKAIVSSLTSTILAKAGARSVIKLIPVVGPIIGGVTSSVFNGASTYAMGEVFKQHFELGGTFLDFDTERLKKFYKEKFEKGKKVAEQLRQEQLGKDQIETSPEPGKIVEPKAKPEPDVKKIPVESTTTTTTGANSQEEILTKLKELGELRNAGTISEEEFDRMKKELIKNF